MSALQIFSIPQVVQLSTGPSQGTTSLTYPLNRTDFRLYRGILNTITVLIRDVDRQPVTFTTGITPYVTIIQKKTKSVLFTGSLTLVDPTQSMWTFNVGPTDIEDWTIGDCTYTVTTVDQYGNVSALFMNRGYDIVGSVEIVDGPYPPGISAAVIPFSAFTLNGMEFYSGPFPGSAQMNNLSGLSTFVAYTTGFTGAISVQGMLDTSTTTDNIQWLAIDTFSLTNVTGVSNFNYCGNFYWVRFVLSGQSVSSSLLNGGYNNNIPVLLKQILLRS